MRSHPFASLLGPLLITLAVAGCSAAIDSDVIPIARQSEQERLARHHMVAAAHPLAVEIGLGVLRRGGNAMDAAVAVQMTLGFVEAPESGIGGGGFLLYRDAATGRMIVYDGRETAPASAHPDQFTLFGQALPLWSTVPGGRAVGVPGLVAMLHMAHEAHGSLAWSDLLAPAISLARAGVAMPDRLQHQIRNDPSLWLFADMRQHFVTPGRHDTPRLRNPALADTLTALAEHGADHFYTGDIATALVERVAERHLWPGDITLSDLAAYRAIEREAVCGKYREWIVCGPPPPSSGGIALLQILGMLEHFPMREFGPDSSIAIHLIAEASRLAFADRERYVGDPDYVDVPVDGLTQPTYLEARAALIDRGRAMEHAPPGAPGVGAVIREAAYVAQGERAGTSHFSVVDASGNMVALTASNEAPFGSRMMSGGFLLNNQLTDFSFDAEQNGRPHPNAVAPGKRPRSSMAPIIVLNADGAPKLVIGSRGGSRIIGHVAKTLVAVLDWKLDIQDAIALPGFVHRGQGLELERDTSVVRHRKALETLGHDVRITTMTSGLHGIERIGESWRGGADPRLDGVAKGD